MKIRSLNGFQRLFVVLAILYTIPIAVLVINLWPSATPINENYIGRMIQAIKDDNPSLPDESPSEIRSKYNDMSDQQFVDSLLRTYGQKNPNTKLRLQDAEKQRQDALNSLNGRRAILVAASLVWWLLSSLIVYLLGWSVGWIYRGFKSEQSVQ